jgi:hypothetical protein
MDLTDRRWHYPRTFAMGVDVGQAHDPTAICVVEMIRAMPNPDKPLETKGLQRPPPLFNVRHLERLKLGMSYPAQVSHVCGLVARPGLAEHEPGVWVDYTGVGRPVFDLFKQARTPKLRGVTITSGHSATRDGQCHNVPKVTLVSRLQALLHTGELKIAATLPDAPVLLRELQEFRVKFTEAGNATWNAREGAHDDLVLALALAVYGAEHVEICTVEPLRI